MLNWKTWTRRLLMPLCALTCATAGAGEPANPPAADAQAAHIQAVAEDAYIYGLPIVMNYAVMYDFSINAASPQFKAPFNRLHNDAKVLTHRDTAVVTPNSDTPYSFAWLDLRSEAFVVSVPAVAAPRYYSVMFADGNTFNYGLIGSLSTGRQAGDYLVVGPDWKGQPPKGIAQVFRSGTQFSMVLFRTQLFGPDDIDGVKAVQAAYRVTPLSTWSKTAVPPAPTSVPFPKIDKELAKSNFFAYLDFALQFAPPGPEEKDIRAKLASIGIGVGDFSRFQALAAQYRRELGLGVAAGIKRVDAAISNGGERRLGWLYAGIAGGDRAHFAGDWLKRAALAKAGIYGLNASEAMYPMTRQLPNGEPLDGGTNRYTLTFPADALPPVESFWSLTIYDGATQLLIDNPLGRYLINSAMLPAMNKNADGSLTIYIQKDPPDKDKESNWLPAPNGPIYLVTRLYGPKAHARQGGWSLPPLVRTP